MTLLPLKTKAFVSSSDAMYNLYLLKRSNKNLNIWKNSNNESSIKWTSHIFQDINKYSSFV